MCSPAVTVWGDILRLFVSTFCYPGDLIDKANQKIEDVLAAIAAREEEERKKKEAERLRIWVLAGRMRLIYACGHFPKRYSKQKRINVTFECRWQVLHFLLVAGPQLNAVVLQGSARFAQGWRKVLIVQLGRCQKPESR